MFSKQLSHPLPLIVYAAFACSWFSFVALERPYMITTAMDNAQLGTDFLYVIGLLLGLRWNRKHQAFNKPLDSASASLLWKAELFSFDTVLYTHSHLSSFCSSMVGCPNRCGCKEDTVLRWKLAAFHAVCFYLPDVPLWSSNETADVRSSAWHALLARELSRARAQALRRTLAVINPWTCDVRMASSASSLALSDCRVQTLSKHAVYIFAAFLPRLALDFLLGRGTRDGSLSRFPSSTAPVISTEGLQDHAESRAAKRWNIARANWGGGSHDE